MASDPHDSDKPFKVQDRRRFSASGEARPDEARPEEEAGAADPAAAAQPEPSTGGGPAARPEDLADPHAPHAQPPELSFATFVISLSTQALALLGEIPDPVQGRTVVDLDGARQFIDILGILREKTRGNLDAREAALLEGALYDLRMKYVDRANGR
jgi:hypothetical protein